MNTKRKLSDFIFDPLSEIAFHPDNITTEYHDGNEEYLLSIMSVIKDHSLQSDEFLEYIKDWPSRYHLSKKRTNILEGIKEIIPKDASVLEIGSGCGAITRWLGEKCQHVDALEGNKLRAEITKERTKDLSNVTVYCGNIQNVEIDKKYDIIVLIGVLEYLPIYDVSSRDPVEGVKKFLHSLLKALTPNGILVLAIENKFGVKYFSGCSEDHTGKRFDGLIGYPDKSPITYSRNEIIKFISEVGFINHQVYHLYPDYKLAETIITEKEAVLSINPYNWIRTPFEDYLQTPINLFSELLFLKSVTDANLFWDFSNSFMVIASSSMDVNLEVDWLIRKFSNNDSSKQIFHHTITLLKDDNQLGSDFNVIRSPLEGGVPNISSEKYEFKLLDNEFISGENLLIKYHRALSKTNSGEEQLKIIKLLYDFLVLSNSTQENDSEGYLLVDGKLIDFTLWNIVLKKEMDFVFIDRKWKSKKPLPVDFVLFRNLFYIFDILAPYIKEKNKNEYIFNNLKLIFPNYPQERLLKNVDYEKDFLEFVTGQSINIDLHYESKVLSYEERIQSYEERIQSYEERIQSYEERIQSYEERILKSDNVINQFSQELMSLKESMIWTILMKFHTGFIEKYLQSGTRRRQIYNLGIYGGRILAKEGFYSFSKKVVDRFYKKKKMISEFNNCEKIFKTSKNLFFRFEENKLPDPILSTYIRGMGICVSNVENLSIKIPDNVRLFFKKSDNFTNNTYCEGIYQSNILDFCILHNVLDKTDDKVIQNYCNVLKPGGILLAYDDLNLLKRLNLIFSSSITDGTIVILKEGSFSPIQNGGVNNGGDNRNLNPDSFLAGFKILEKSNFVDQIETILKKVDDIYVYSIDVIIPVYNAYNDLIKCLYSVIVHQENYRIILINDNSSDNRILNLFLRLKNIDSNKIILLENHENLGFVKTVNRGMQYSDNHVILLNSDTIVTKGWATKLQKCANFKEKIGTVTPFTNNGTICSIPGFCAENDIPPGFTVDNFGRYVEKISIRQYPTIPTAVGFCMYIKREVIDKVGYFDEESFGKGYGEENDFCMRAIKQGYIHVLCDDVFVFHKGEASFSEKKKELIQKNTATLTEMYPEYLPTVHSFIKNNPLKILHSNILKRMTTWDQYGDKRRILYILHGWGGGTEKNVKDLINSLDDGYCFFVLQVEKRCLVLTEINNHHEVSYTYPLSSPISEYSFHHDEYEGLLFSIVDNFEIDLIHIHHLIGHTFDIIRVSKLREIPLLFTIHDFYAVCPNINLLDSDYNLCDNKDIYSKCDVCLLKSKKIQPGFIKKWRSHFSELFECCTTIIAPSEPTARIILSYYPNIHNYCVVIEHGTDLFMSRPLTDLKKDIIEISKPYYNHNSIEGVFHIAFIGGLGLNKGRNLFYSLAKSPELKKRVKWSVFGVTDLNSQPKYYSSDNIYIHGYYNGFNELRKKIERESVNLIIFPSICNETYSYTLSEAWALGIPVLVSNLGALKDRVERNGGGWIVKNTDLDGFKEKILEILNSDDDYNKKKREIMNISLKSIQEMADDYNELYSRIIGEDSDLPHLFS